MIAAVKSASVLGALTLAASILFTPRAVTGQGAEGIKDTTTDQLFAESVHILGGNRNPVLRWYDAVNFAVVGEPDEKVVELITSTMNEISLLTGINYRRIRHEFDDVESYLAAIVESPPYDLSLCDRNDQTHCANYVVIMTNQGTMHKIAESLPLRPIFQAATASENQLSCFFSPGISQGLSIKRNVVYVQADLEQPMLHTCLHEEIYQSFGLFGDSTDSEYFSFNNKVAAKNITVFDKALLTSLYDNEYPLGTLVEPIARQMSDYCKTNCSLP